MSLPLLSFFLRGLFFFFFFFFFSFSILSPQQTNNQQTINNSDLSKFRANNYPDILIATPGRLNDHLENNGLAQHCRSLRCLIFDEADQLLEMGFRPAITKLLAMLPPKNTRQTTLFSATMPNDVMGIARFALNEKFEYVDCVGKDDQGTHQRVPQYCTVYGASLLEKICGLLHPDENNLKLDDSQILQRDQNLFLLSSFLFSSSSSSFQIHLFN